MKLRSKVAGKDEMPCHFFVLQSPHRLNAKEVSNRRPFLSCLKSEGNDKLVLQVRKTKLKGRGLFTASFIPAGTRVLALEGQRAKVQDLPPDSMALQIDDDWWLYSDGSSLDDCVNHSCDPNTGFARNDPVLYALRDIEPEEELSWDYSTSISLKGWSLSCLCGSKSCRGVVLSFDELTLEERRRLGPIALRYLQRRMSII
jgi:SET domain